MQDNDEKLGTQHPIKPAVMGFPADKVTCRMQTFECDPFDLLGNAPYSNPPKSSPEKGEKSRREKQIFNCRKQWIFDDGPLENQWQLPKCLLDFECSLLRPLEYICILNFVARDFPQGAISSQSRYDRFDTSAYLVLLHATWAIWFAPYYILHTAT